MEKKNIDFANLSGSYESFRELAKNPHLSLNEKIGFPDTYREGYEEFIFEDIKSKLPLLLEQNKIVLDIGSGCGGLAQTIEKHCQTHSHTLILSDCPEILDLRSNSDLALKVPGPFPQTKDKITEIAKDGVDVIICYSVLNAIYKEANFWDFLDNCVSILKPGGQFLLGDIPNISKRKRFFSSENGIRHHQKFMKTTEVPEVTFNKLEPKKIDDAVILSIIMRYQSSGYNCYLLPQNERLPFLIGEMIF